MESKHGLSALNLPLKPGVSTELRPPPVDSRGTAAGPGASGGADKPSAVAADQQPRDEAAPARQPTTTRTIERVGVLLVHGIGEQRRFEHLEGQTRKIAEAIIQRETRTGKKTRSTFEISPPVGGAPYQSEQESWAGGRFPPVRALVRHGENLEHETHLHFHEVWWADVNERYTLKKQIRFWAWGLAMWLLPGKPTTKVAGFESSMRLPEFPDTRSQRLSKFNRLQLFFAAWIFLLSSFSVTLAVFLLKRLNFGVWSPVNTFVNYLSAVRLYTQNHRSGGGPLDGMHEPPRFAIRRRMVRAIVDVACANYDRWYILAHSLGSVVAFNGLMTHAHSLPNYLDERRWRRLVRRTGWVGPPREGRHETIAITAENPEIPPRPLWINDDLIVVYREKLFGGLRGFLTYGSPLDKFAGMWPAYVAINLDADVFQKEIEWINIFDRTDPVAAALKAYDGTTLQPVNYGYTASNVLLLSHLKYLDLSEDKQKRGKQPADRIVDWLLLEDRFERPPDPEARNAGWYQRFSATAVERVVRTYLQWFAVLVILAYVGCWALRWILHLLSVPYEECIGTRACDTALGALLQLNPSLWETVAFAFWCAVAAFLIGVVGYFLAFDRQDHPEEWDPQP